MTKKTYKKFNFWQLPTESNVVEKVDPSFFKSVEKELQDHEKSLEAKIINQNDENLYSKSKTSIEKDISFIDEQNINSIKTVDAKFSSNVIPKTITSEMEQNYKDIVQDIFESNGGQWKVLLYCAERCLETGTLSTGYIKLPYVAKKLNLNQRTMYTAIYRLEKQKKLIIRQKGKEGAGGKSRFMIISDKIKNYILSHRDNMIVNEMTQTSIEERLSETTEMDEWKKIDVSPLKDIGFNEKHLLQLKKYNTPKIVQESINQFSFGLKNNEQTKKYSNPLLVLIGVLRKGEAWLEQNYMSPNEIAFSQLMDQRKNKMDKLKQIEEEYFFLEYAVWEKSLTSQIKEALFPEDIRKTNLSPAKNAFLRSYFKENIWPTKMPMELLALIEELNLDLSKVETLKFK